MYATLEWKSDMAFKGDADGHEVPMDAKSPIGKNSAPTPKELVALGIGGCTAMDVIALLKKYKQLPESFTLDVDITPSQGKHPAVFEKALIIYRLTGQIDAEKLIEAVQLSQTKFCGVSAMLSKAFPIHYKIELNSKEIGTGLSAFS